MQGCSCHVNSRFAIEHGNGTRRIYGRAPSSSARAKSCDQTEDHTPRKQPEQSEPALISRDIDESKTEVDMPTSRASQEKVARIVRRLKSDYVSSSCQCLFYHKVVSKQSHFATFPDELVKRCVSSQARPKRAYAPCAPRRGKGKRKRTGTDPLGTGWHVSQAMDNGVADKRQVQVASGNGT